MLLTLRTRQPSVVFTQVPSVVNSTSPSDVIKPVLATEVVRCLHPIGTRCQVGVVMVHCVWPWIDKMCCNPIATSVITTFYHNDLF